MKNNILIIDDDIELCQLLRKCVEKEGIAVELIHNGINGLKKAIEEKFHLIVLDVMLPEMNGFDVLTEIRKTNDVPVLMLTAKDSELDKVIGLRLGADDYLSKPFNINEFLARVHSLIRRYTMMNNLNNVQDETICFKGLFIDTKSRTVTIKGDVVDLTGKEFDLLFFLASHKGQVFTKKQIYSNVWSDEYAFDDSNVMAYMSKLRKKIESDMDKSIYIQTVWGVGYRFSQEV